MSDRGIIIRDALCVFLTSPCFFIFGASSHPYIPVHFQEILVFSIINLFAVKIFRALSQFAFSFFLMPLNFGMLLLLA